jgi:16S rRNA A1518/A1519 N6-dimethyltransferase RsmA/KsgA/DIM1 with predicted DNA glycosylase/AP lyase activity
MAPPANGEALQHRHFGDAFAGADDRWTRAVDRANARRVLRILRDAVTPGARVLEIGPGHGALLMALAAGG